MQQGIIHRVTYNNNNEDATECVGVWIVCLFACTGIGANNTNKWHDNGWDDEGNKDKSNESEGVPLYGLVPRIILLSSEQHLIKQPFNSCFYISFFNHLLCLLVLKTMFSYLKWNCDFSPFLQTHTHKNKFHLRFVWIEFSILIAFLICTIFANSVYCKHGKISWISFYRFERSSKMFFMHFYFYLNVI